VAYSHYRSITIDHTKCGSSNSTNFPVLISGTYSYLATVANGGLVTSSSGYDIQFYSDSALTTALKFERVIWSASTGLCEFYVKVPTVSSSVDTVIYMAYGNSAVTTDQQDAANTWDSNYVGVYHMGDGSSLNANDSTTNANNGTATSVSAASGQVGGAASFNGSSSHIDIGSATSLQFTTAFTLSAWVKCNNFTTWRSILGKQAAGGNPKPFDWYIQGSAPYDPPTGRVTLYLGQGTGGNFHSSTTALTANTWQMATATVNGASIKHYLNGAADGVGTNSYTLVSGTEHIQIGSRSNLDIWMDGYIDEVRISNVDRSADWILTEYNSTSNPSTFYTVGSQVGGSSFMPPLQRRNLVPLRRSYNW